MKLKELLKSEDDLLLTSQQKQDTLNYNVISWFSIGYPSSEYVCILIELEGDKLMVDYIK